MTMSNTKKKDTHSFTQDFKKGLFQWVCSEELPTPAQPKKVKQFLSNNREGKQPVLNFYKVPEFNRSKQLKDKHQIYWPYNI